MGHKFWSAALLMKKRRFKVSSTLVLLLKNTKGSAYPPIN